jgi:hypothetical protein
MIKRKSRNTGTKKAVLEIKDFKGGSNDLLDEARIKSNEAKTALNLMQVQDGLWKTRWGSAYYTQALPFNCDGAAEYVKSDGTTELIAVAGGHVWKSTNGGAWTEVEEV